MSPDPARRDLIATLGAAAGLGLAGCNSLTGGESTATATTTPAEPTLAAVLRSDEADDAEGVTNSDNFGSAVAVDGGTAIVGAHGDESENGNHAGSAYAFDATDAGWTQEAKLTRPSRPRGAFFGTTVELVGGTAVVASPASTGTEGTVTVFERTGDGWVDTTTLDLWQSLHFGADVAFDGDAIVVGVRAVDERSDGPGGAFVYERASDQWERTAKFTGTASGEDRYGRTVALSGDTALVGAPTTETDVGTRAGVVEVYERAAGGWSHATTLTHPDGAPDDYFGQTVALAGDTALISTPGKDNPDREYSGAATVFERSGGRWRKTADLAPPGGEERGRFPATLELQRDRACIGSEEHRGHRSGLGAVYVHERTASGWSGATRVALEDDERLEDESGFGWSGLAATGDTVMVGASGDHNSAGTSVGAVYVFDLS